MPGLVAAKVGADVTLTDDSSRPEVWFQDNYLMIIAFVLSVTDFFKNLNLCVCEGIFTIELISLRQYEKSSCRLAVQDC